MLEFLNELPSSEPYELAMEVEDAICTDLYLDRMQSFFENLFKIIDRERQKMPKERYYRRLINLKRLIEDKEFKYYLKANFNINDSELDIINNIRQSGNIIKHERETISPILNKENEINEKRVRFHCVFVCASNYYYLKTGKKPPAWSESEFEDLLAEHQNREKNEQRLADLEKKFEQFIRIEKSKDSFEPDTQINVEELINKKLSEKNDTDVQYKYLISALGQIENKVDSLMRMSTTDEAKGNKEKEQNSSSTAKGEKPTCEVGKNEGQLQWHREIDDRIIQARERKINEMDKNYKSFLGKTHEELKSMPMADLEALIDNQELYFLMRKRICSDISIRAKEYCKHYYSVFEKAESVSDKSAKETNIETEQRNRNTRKANIVDSTEYSFRAKRERVCKVCGKMYISQSKSKTCPECKVAKRREM